MITVDVMAPDLTHESFTTGKSEPRGNREESRRRGSRPVRQGAARKTIAWAQIGDRTRGLQERGRRATRSGTKILPLTHKAEGSVVDHQGKPIAGARIGVRVLEHPTNRVMHQDLRRQGPAAGLRRRTGDQGGEVRRELAGGNPRRTVGLASRYVGPAIGVSANAWTLSHCDSHAGRVGRGLGRLRRRPAGRSPGGGGRRSAHRSTRPDARRRLGPVRDR